MDNVLVESRRTYVFLGTCIVPLDCASNALAGKLSERFSSSIKSLGP